MEEIIVYPSKKRIVTTLVAVVVLIAFLVVLDLLSPDPIKPVLWLLIAAPCLVPIAIAVYHLIKNRPCMFISDEGIKVNSKKPWEICFADVESFFSVNYRGYTLIGVRYKKDNQKYISEEEMEEGRKERMASTESPGAPYEIRADGLSMKSRELLELLNARLAAPLRSPQG